MDNIHNGNQCPTSQRVQAGISRQAIATDHSRRSEAETRLRCSGLCLYQSDNTVLDPVFAGRAVYPAGGAGYHRGLCGGICVRRADGGVCHSYTADLNLCSGKTIMESLGSI